MNKVFGILLIGLTAVLFNSHSIAFVPVEEAIQKRVEMFKTSKSNIKKLRQLIRSGDASKAVPLVDFHIKWSKEMLIKIIILQVLLILTSQRQLNIHNTKKQRKNWRVL